MVLWQVTDSEGDCVIQNAANSGVGRAVIQLCKSMGVTTVNVVRTRPDIDELKQELYDLGANYVLTQEELGTAKTREWIQCDPAVRNRISLGLNCVGGKAATEMARSLS